MPVAGNYILLSLADGEVFLLFFLVTASLINARHLSVCLLPCSLSALSLAVEQTRVCRKLLSAQGRGRYLLRLALSRKVLPQFFTHLLHTARLLEV